MKNRIQRLVLSALFFSLGIVLPFFTGQIPQIGSMLLPMHIPVFLCGLICGWKYGLLIGLLLPITRSLLFTMPPLLAAISMSFELATYGCVVGYIYEHSKWQCVKMLYRSLIISMILGRIVWCIAQMIILGINGQTLTLMMFISASLLNAIPGIILQLILIPAIMVALDKSKLYTFKKKVELNYG